MSQNPSSNEKISDQFSLLDEIPYAIQIVEDGIFVYCNQATLKLFDAEKTVNHLKKPYSTIFQEKQPDRKISADLLRSHVSKALAGEKIIVEWTHQTLKSRLITCKVSLHQIQFRVTHV
ncbi:MAG: hypothetical protein LUQ50_09845 [Methanospirillum sp.]|uniref:hypothetical protein n=1 Tax=Methanospirillum sp. TaxID=45200 RepID=UPI0023693F64|nr:hypothetical protein [Methanospirillum sp.]MDD1729358.1 hypothetical protein [Methanospirillum sp.]